METTHTPVIDLHTGGTVTSVATCETCVWLVVTGSQFTAPSTLHTHCRQAGTRVSPNNSACFLYRSLTPQ